MNNSPVLATRCQSSVDGGMFLPTETLCPEIAGPGPRSHVQKREGIAAGEGRDACMVRSWVMVTWDHTVDRVTD